MASPLADNARAVREAARTFTALVRLNRQRAEADREGEAALAARADGRRAFSREAAHAVLTGRGVDAFMLEEGSMPQASLDLVAQTLRAELDAARPLVGLHVGNFVGVSLAHFTDVLVAIHPGSVVVSVDPDLPHRAVTAPQGHVLALLEHFGLAGNSIVVPGFSLERNLGDDVDSARQPALANVLASLAVTGARFDAALLDGNHDADYLERELDGLQALLARKCVVALDDVNPDPYPGLVAAFDRLVARPGATELARDGRVGIAALSA